MASPTSNSRGEIMESTLDSLTPCLAVPVASQEGFGALAFSSSPLTTLLFSSSPPAPFAFQKSNTLNKPNNVTKPTLLPPVLAATFSPHCWYSAAVVLLQPCGGKPQPHDYAVVAPLGTSPSVPRRLSPWSRDRYGTTPSKLQGSSRGDAHPRELLLLPSAQTPAQDAAIALGSPRTSDNESILTQRNKKQKLRIDP